MKHIHQFFLLSFVALLSFIAFFHPIITFNEDLGRHLLLGKIIFQTHHVPPINLLSYTYPTFPFINSHWLSEVIFYTIFKLYGSLGLLFFTTLLGTILFVILFQYIYKCFGFFPTIFTFFFTILLFYQRAEVRPQIFSYFLTSIFLVILLRNKQRPTKWLFALLPLAFLWVNLHIYFFLGPLLIGLFLLDDVFSARKHTTQLLLTFLGSMLITVMNPNSLHGAVFPFTFWQNYGLAIGENVNSIFALIHYQYPPVYILFTQSTILLVLFIIFRKKTEIIDWLLFVTFTLFGLIAVRDLPIFALAVAVPFAKLLFFVQKTLFSERFGQYAKVFTYFSRIVIFFLSFAVCLIFFKQDLRYGTTENYKPGIDFFLKAKLRGPIFNDYDIGSYLDYRLYPQTKVFVDNRPEAYPASFFQHIYVPLQESSTIFYKEDQHYHFQSIIFSKTNDSTEAHTFLRWIRKDTKWIKVYEDQYMLILKRS